MDLRSLNSNVPSTRLEDLRGSSVCAVFCVLAWWRSGAVGAHAFLSLQGSVSCAGTTEILRVFAMSRARGLGLV